MRSGYIVQYRHIAGWEVTKESVTLLTRRLELESDHLHFQVAEASYTTDKARLLDSEDMLAQQVANSAITQPTQADVKDLEKQIAALQEEVANLHHNQKPRYPAEFWILLAAAVCSWSVTLYNLIFSVLKERRERRREKRDEATVLLYLESDLPKFLADKDLSTRPKS